MRGSESIARNSNVQMQWELNEQIKACILKSNEQTKITPKNNEACQKVHADLRDFLTYTNNQD